MWIIAQDKKKAYKIINCWLSDEKNEEKDICITYGTGSDDIFWDKVGTYKTERAEKVFQKLLDSVGYSEKFNMPKE